MFFCTRVIPSAATDRGTKREEEEEMAWKVGTGGQKESGLEENPE